MRARPKVDPRPVLARFFDGDAYTKLPWDATSFCPLLHAALGELFPEDYRRALAGHMERSQAEDGYVGDHVAAVFHMAHSYRLIGRPAPKVDRMVARVLRDRNPDGGFGHFPGRHSDMDAVYFQLGTLIQAGRVPGVDRALSEADRRALGWGHAMRPERA